MTANSSLQQEGKPLKSDALVGGTAADLALLNLNLLAQSVPCYAQPDKTTPVVDKSDSCERSMIDGKLIDAIWANWPSAAEAAPK
jgi:hypothetical protein